ncbi:B-cell receptor CD22-like isoform X2 [Acipenser ruthenus]|uniref:B-cell receptor CD22-like isoform X2 n=1 Tax=Acipenser ruthenus TaxID=7906 RepID=UPI002741B5DF|nr:B-cell receptor CD22-like isoform X2 [Acipenser ruthenus]
MIATEKLLLISCLFQGIICNELKAFMPQRIKALSGSCVLIPCTFTIEERLESAMVEPARGIWMTSYNFRDIVFDSSRHYGEKTLKAELLGKVTNKNCTTIINHLKRSDSKSYFFRADPPKYTFRENVRLEVVDSPDRPAISPSSAVKEGAPTSLACTAPAPCPREPPTLVWSDTLNGSVEIEQVEQQDGTKAVSSVLTFTASHLHHNKDITCTAQYPVGSESKSAGKVSTLHVLYSPKNTLVLINPSGEIHEGDHVTLSCSSNANPAVSRYTWFKVKGDNINEKSAEQNLTFTDINPSDSGLYYCEARNEHGAENSTAVQLNVAYSPKNTLVLINPSGEIHEGDHVTLSCSSNANPAVSRYTWFKVKGDNITEKSVEQDLTFTDINPSDSGLYYCEARNEHGAENSTAVQLNVAYSPKNTSVLINPSGEIHEGDHVTLSCSSNANPAVSRYTWFEVKGDNITEKSVEQYLTFTDINLNDSGLYYCEARNEHGAENSTAVQLNVAYPPKNTSVLINPSGEIHEGDHVTLSCSSNANPAVSRYTWFEVKGNNITEKSVEQNLTFTDINPSDSGLYYCEARNEHGTENSTAVQLNVAYSPKNTLVLINPSGEIQEGDHVTLSCSSNANPAVSRYTWFKVKGDNINEKSAEQDLTFTDINPSDSGLYYCEARNEHGAENSTAVQLNVAYPPKNTLVLINPSGEIQEGDHVTLSCSSNANPAVSRYTWFEVKGDNINEKSAEQNLTFTDINPSDSGLYYCEARNEHGAENSTAVQLNVGCMPQISHESSCSKDDTESITCICVSRGSPSPITEWRIAGNKLENNTDRGSISNSKLEDHTMRSTLILLEPLAKNEAIQCLSKNRIGTASFQFHVFHEQKEAPATPCIYVVMGTAAVQMLATILVVFIMKRKRKVSLDFFICSELLNTVELVLCSISFAGF